MNPQPINAYDADFHVAEIYDRCETEMDDVHFIRGLIGASAPRKILEPFCGTGRILIPLALDGHTLLGMDRSVGMLDRLGRKIRGLPAETRQRINVIQADVLCEAWPQGFDLVILGGNCFYELAASDEQEKCVAQAFRSLKPDGSLFVDNNHMEGGLAESWQHLGVVEPSLSGRCSDGTTVESTRETIWFDASRRLARFRRRTTVTLPDGSVVAQEYIQQKHPISQAEVQGWLEKYDFVVEDLFGNYDGAPYVATSPRAIFWARRN